MIVALALAAATVPESTADLNTLLAFVALDAIVSVVTWWAAEHILHGGIAGRAINIGSSRLIANRFRQQGTCKSIIASAIGRCRFGYGFGYWCIRKSKNSSFSLPYCIIVIDFNSLI